MTNFANNLSANTQAIGCKNKTKPCYIHTTEDYAVVEKGEEGLYEMMEWFLGSMDEWRR